MLEIYKEEMQNVCYCDCGYGCTCVNCNDFAPAAFLSAGERTGVYEQLVGGVR